MSADDMSSMANADTMKAFQDKLASVTQAAAADPDYDKIPLDTAADQSWFTDLAYKYYKKDITGAEFVQQGIAKFPGYGDSFQYIADKLL